VSLRRILLAMISQFLLLIVGTLICYLVFHLVQFLYYDLTSPLWGMVGPKSTSLVLGNFKQMAVRCSSSASIFLSTKYHQDDALVTDK
jgi:hypothetical protein